jgi:hypothetical protein
MVSERIRSRLIMREAILAMIDRRRADTGDPNVGMAAEKQVLDLELRDLERAVAAQESTERQV